MSPQRLILWSALCLSPLLYANSSYARHGKITGALQTPEGLQVHPICLSRPKDSADTRKKVRTLFKKNIRSAFQKVNRCQKKYPELNFYLKKWSRRMSRAVIYCHTPEKEKTELESYFFGDGEIRLFDGQAARVYDRPREFSPEFKKVPGFKTRGIFQIYRGNYTILLSNDRIDYDLYYSQHRDEHDRFIQKFHRFQDLGDILVHEGLHFTHANNNSEHGDIYNPTADCEHSPLDDRIYTINALCGGGIWNLSFVEHTLKERIDRCGMKRACIDPFHKNLIHKKIPYALPRRGLSKRKARKLCEKIYQLGIKQEEELNL